MIFIFHFFQSIFIFQNRNMCKSISCFLFPKWLYFNLWKQEEEHWTYLKHKFVWKKDFRMVNITTMYMNLLFLRRILFNRMKRSRFIVTAWCNDSMQLRALSNSGKKMRSVVKREIKLKNPSESTDSTERTSGHAFCGSRRFFVA